MILTFNNKQFTKNTIQGNAVGYYKVFKKTVGLYNNNNEKIGVVTAHKVLAKASKVDGGFWYSYGEIDEIGAYSSYMEQCNDIDRAVELICN